MVLKKFSLKVSWVYLRMRHVFPTDVSPINTILSSASNVSAAIALIWPCRGALYLEPQQIFEVGVWHLRLFEQTSGVLHLTCRKLLGIIRATISQSQIQAFLNWVTYLSQSVAYKNVNSKLFFVVDHI